MPTLETIRRLTIEGQSRGMEKLVGDLNRVADAQRGVSDAASGVTTTTEENRTVVERAGRVFEALQRRIDPLHRELRQVEKDFRDLNVAAGQNIGLDKYAENTAKIIARTKEHQNAERERAAELSRVDRAMQEYADKAARRAQQQYEYEERIATARSNLASEAAQQNFNQFMGVRDDPRGSEARSSANAITSALQEQETIDRALVEYEQMRVKRAQEHLAYEERVTKSLNEQRDAQTAADSQRAIQQLTGQNRGATGTGIGQGATYSALEDHFAEQDRLAKSANALKAQIQPVQHAFEVMNRELLEYTVLAGKGAISTDQLAMAQNLAKAKFDMVARGLGKDGLAGNLRLTSNQLTNLSYQFNDVLSGFAMGQSPFTIIAQQTGQFYQILAGARGGVVEGIKSAGSALLGMITPARAAGAALVGAATLAFTAWNRFDNQQIEIRRSLGGLGRNIGFSPEQFDQMAERIGALGHMSTRTAVEITTAMTKIGRFSGENLEAMGKVSKDFAATLGVELPGAVQTLAQSMTSFSGIERLNQQMRFLDGVTLNQIRSLFNLGKSYDAVNLAVSKLGDYTKGTYNDTLSQTKGLWEQISIALANADRAAGAYLAKAREIATVNRSIVRPPESATQPVSGGLYSGIASIFKPGPPISTQADISETETRVPLPPRRPDSLMSTADAQDRFEEAVASARKAKQVQEDLNYVTTRASELSKEFGDKNYEQMKRLSEVSEFVTRIQKEGTQAQKDQVIELSKGGDAWDRLSTMQKSYTDEQGNFISSSKKAQDSLQIEEELTGRVSEARRIELERRKAVLEQAGVEQSSAERTVAITRGEIILRKQKQTAIEDELYSLQKNIDLTGKSGEQLETQQQLLQRQLAFRQQNIPLSQEETALLEARISAQIRASRVQEQVTAIYNASVRPSTDLNDTIKAATLLLNQGVIGWNAYSNAILDARIKAAQAEQTFSGGLSAGLMRVQKDFGDVSKQVENLTFNTFGNATTALLDVLDGTRSAADGFKDFGKTAIRAMNEMIIKMGIMAPLAKSLFGMGGGGGLLSSLFGGGKGGGGGESFGSASSFAMVDIKHRGGMVGANGERRFVHPAYFDGAPRLHGGTLRADERPTILQTGEVVLSRQDVSSARGGASGGGGHVSLNINVAGARGNREIEEMVASGVQMGIAGYDKGLQKGGLARRMAGAQSRGQIRR